MPNRAPPFSCTRRGLRVAVRPAHRTVFALLHRSWIATITTAEHEPWSVDNYTLTFEDVPVDGFWSPTIYNRDGFMGANPCNS